MTSNLYRMLAGAGLLLGMVPVMASAQQATTVSGRVTNEASAPVPGASVSIPSLGVGSYSGNDGRFTFTIAANRVTGQNVSLVARRIGYQPVTASVALSGASVTHDFRLSTATTQLEGVVVTALGLEREKRSLGIAAQSVQGSDLNKTQTPNIVNALSGKVAGVKVVGSTNFGGSARVVIRGENSISGNNQPLWVVDGIAIDNSQFTNATQARGYGGFDYGNAIQDLNTEDIENVSVLKGPAAAALYGSRAANGAIVVTTRSGKGASRGFQATASSNLTFDNISKLPDYQNSYGQGSGGEFEFVDGQGSGTQDGVDESWGPKLDAGLSVPQWFSNGAPAPWVSHPDNVRDFFRTGTTMSNNVSATGSGDRANFRLSFGSENMQGIVPNSVLKRITAGVNGTASLSEKLQANASVQYVRNKANNRPGTGYDELNPIMGFTWFGRQVDTKQLQALVTDSTLQAFNRGNGIDFTNQVNWNYNYHNNPYWNVNQNSNSDDRNRFIGSAQLQYKPTSWLTGMVRTGSDFYNSTRANNVAQGWIGGYTVAGTNSDFTQGGFVNDQFINNENNTDFLLTAVTTPLERLGLTVNLGGNRRTKTQNQRSLFTDKLITPGVYNMSNAATIYPAFQYDERRQINSLYGTTQFAFNDYFFVDVTGRNDWSSTLPKGKNSYFYPSVSSSLVFTDLMPSLKIGGLSYGKLRGAWTRVGSDADPYLLALTYTPAAPYFGQSRFAVPQTVTNPELKPEQTQAWEVGTELSFLDGRAGVDLTYYTKRTTDQILTASVSRTTGFDAAAVNAGSLSNKGIEVQFTATPVKMSNSFTWDLTANYAHNQNKLESLYGASNTYQIGSKFFNTSIEARVGQPYGSIVGYAFRRDSVSHKVVLGSNGVPLRALTTSVLGNIQPKWTGGLINTLRYKGFDLSGQIDARIGGQLYSATNAWGTYAGILKVTENRDSPITTTGVDSKGNAVTMQATPEDYYHGIGYNSGDEANIVDASFVKLREVRLGWAVPQSLLGRSTYRLNVAVVGRNLMTHSNSPNIDPETAFAAGNQQGQEFGQLPATRSLGFQVSVTP